MALAGGNALGAHATTVAGPPPALLSFIRPACPPARCQAAELPSQVDSLLKSVEATNIFEAEMARRFEGAVERDASGSEEAEADGGDGGGERAADDSSPASRVRARYERLARERQRAAEGESPERRKEQVAGAGGRGRGSCAAGEFTAGCAVLLGPGNS